MNALLHVQRLRIDADLAMSAEERRDCTTPLAHRLRGRYEALPEVEGDLRRAASEER